MRSTWTTSAIRCAYGCGRVSGRSSTHDATRLLRRWSQVEGSAVQDELGRTLRVRRRRVVPVGHQAGDLLGRELRLGDELEELRQQGPYVRDADVQGGARGVHVHHRKPGAGAEIVAGSRADPSGA